MEQGHHNRRRSPYNCRRPEGCLDTAAAAVTDATLAPHPRVYSLPALYRTMTTNSILTLPGPAALWACNRVAACAKPGHHERIAEPSLRAHLGLRIAWLTQLLSFLGWPAPSLTGRPQLQPPRSGSRGHRRHGEDGMVTQPSPARPVGIVGARPCRAGRGPTTGGGARARSGLREGDGGRPAPVGAQLRGGARRDLLPTWIG